MTDRPAFNALPEIVERYFDQNSAFFMLAPAHRRTVALERERHPAWPRFYLFMVLGMDLGAGSTSPSVCEIGGIRSKRCGCAAMTGLGAGSGIECTTMSKTWDARRPISPRPPCSSGTL